MQLGTAAPDLKCEFADRLAIATGHPRRRANARPSVRADFYLGARTTRRSEPKADKRKPSENLAKRKNKYCLKRGATDWKVLLFDIVNTATAQWHS
jgi:hypothetical protein